MTEIEKIQRESVLIEAESWLKTPFHHRQCIKGAGVDCAMFLYSVFNNTGLVPDIEIEEYPHDWHMHRDGERFLSHIMKYANWIPDPPYLPGDVLMYKYGRCFSHSAIIVSWPMIIHAFSYARMVTYDDVDHNLELKRMANGKGMERKMQVFRYRNWESN